MSTFVLVHGAWHGAWCWYRMLPRLERAGHRAVAIDLPGLGRDTTPIPELTLDLWTESVCRTVAAAPEPVVLVGHSRGGIVISQVAERLPRRVRSLVYVAAFLLRDGEALLPLMEADGTAEILGQLVPAADGKSATVKDEAIRPLVYGRCPDEDVALAKLCLRPEPIAPMATPIRVTEAAFGSVPRFYVECLQDRTVPPHLQKKMYGASPCRNVFSMDTDHSPFFSAPDELARHLIAAAS